jgi:hypothetical protein
MAMAADRRLVEHLQERRAISPETAQPIDARPGMERRRLARLVRMGVVVETQPDTYYLLESGWHAYLHRMGRRLRIVLILGLVLLGLAFLLRGR